MKKQLLTLAALALSVSAISAQDIIGAYGVKTGQATAVDMTGATEVCSGELSPEQSYGPSWTETGSGSFTHAGFPIGFDFNYNGKAYTEVIITGGGLVIPTAGEFTYTIPAYVRNIFNSSDAQGTPAIGAPGIFQKGGEDYKVSYKLTGTAPDRMFVIEYDNLLTGISAFFTNTTFSYQLQLCENGNINYVFTAYEGSQNIGTGMRGTSTTVGTRGTYAEPTIEVGTTMATVTGSSVLKDLTPGMSVTFTSPAPVSSPTAQPTDLELTDVTSISLKGSFTAAEGSDSYLVLASKDATLTELPVDKTWYLPAAADAEEPNMLGNAQIVYFGEKTDFTAQLSGDTDWHIFVFSANYLGTGGPLYLTTNPLTSEARTLPAQATVTISEQTTDSFTLNIEGVAEDNEVMIISTPNYFYYNNTFMPISGAFGNEVQVTTEADPDDPSSTPETSTKPLNQAVVGDILVSPGQSDATWQPIAPNGGTVVYIGKANEPVVIEGLAPNTISYFKVIPMVPATETTEAQFGTEPSYISSQVNLQPSYLPNSALALESFPDKVPQWWESSKNSRGDDAWEGNPSRFAAPTMYYTSAESNSEDGTSAYLQFTPIKADGRHYVLTFNLKWGKWQSNNFQDYGDWTENDLLAFEASTDGGETWETLVNYTKDSHPIFNTWSFNVIKVDLSRYYHGELVLVRLHTNMANSAGRVALDWTCPYTLTQEEFIAVPEVKVDDSSVTDTSANVSWFTADDTQNKFELVYGEKYPEGTSVAYTTVMLEDIKEYSITGLKPNTIYYVKVRAIVPVYESEDEGDDTSDDNTGTATLATETGDDTPAIVDWTESEWSDEVRFRTLPIPNPADPGEPVANLDFFGQDNSVIITWATNDELNKFEFQYRESIGEWSEIIETTEPMVILKDLAYGTRYLMRLRAYGEREFESGWVQGNFTTPDAPIDGINAVTGEVISVKAVANEIQVNGAAGLNVAVYNTNGAAVAVTANAADAEAYNVAAGVYVVVVGNETYKVIVK